MHIEFLVEEPSAQAALAYLVPKILGDISFKIHSFQCKNDLIANLPGRLRGYRKWIPSDWRIVVLIDEDHQNCMELKEFLERCAIEAGFVTKSEAAARGLPQFQVLNRVAVEELEAWFFGDVQAMAEAYPGVPLTLDRQQKYRDPDRIRGGTWEALERILQRAGYHKGGLEKITAARAIARRMVPERNQSRSFQAFRSGLLAFLQ